MPIAVVSILGSLFTLVYFSVSGPNALPTAAGVVGLAAMAGCLVLAARWKWLDSLLGGPDKAYRVHRWFGYFGIPAFLSHWIIGVHDVRTWETPLVETAESLGVIPAILVTLLAVISMLRLVPYRIWKYSHYAMGPLFLIAAFHAVVTPSPLTETVLDYVVKATAGAGVLGWVGTLFIHLWPTKTFEVISATRAVGATDLRLRPLGRPLNQSQVNFPTFGSPRKDYESFTRSR